ncbi:MAG TPA: cytochrome c [Pyrinomonadaceae bacterium]|jgi:mono/diheme cytochrome c family protein|nr:cytochrome c [Pyrinomonadaceae bacterium]
MRRLKLLILVAILLFAAAACGNSVNTSTSAVPVDKSNVAAVPSQPEVTPEPEKPFDGKELYAQNCMICHKDSGKGGPVTIAGKKLKPADLTRANVKAWTDDKFVKDVQEGDPEEGMPSFEQKLKPEEIRAIVAHIRTLQG